MFVKLWTFGNVSVNVSRALYFLLRVHLITTFLFLSFFPQIIPFPVLNPQTLPTGGTSRAGSCPTHLVHFAHSCWASMLLYSTLVRDLPRRITHYALFMTSDPLTPTTHHLIHIFPYPFLSVLKHCTHSNSHCVHVSVYHFQ